MYLVDIFILHRVKLMAMVIESYSEDVTYSLKIVF